MFPDYLRSVTLCLKVQVLLKFSYQEMGVCVDTSDAIRENGNKKTGQSITDFNEDRKIKDPSPSSCWLSKSVRVSVHRRQE